MRQAGLPGGPAPFDPRHAKASSPLPCRPETSRGRPGARPWRLQRPGSPRASGRLPWPRWMSRTPPGACPGARSVSSFRSGSKIWRNQSQRLSHPCTALCAAFAPVVAVHAQYIHHVVTGIIIGRPVPAGLVPDGVGQRLGIGAKGPEHVRRAPPAEAAHHVTVDLFVYVRAAGAVGLLGRAPVIAREVHLVGQAYDELPPEPGGRVREMIQIPIPGSGKDLPGEDGVFPALLVQVHGFPGQHRNRPKSAYGLQAGPGEKAFLPRPGPLQEKHRHLRF